jgi:hypothetical protein
MQSLWFIDGVIALMFMGCCHYLVDGVESCYITALHWSLVSCGAGLHSSTRYCVFGISKDDRGKVM